jgi:hypothetical protein
MAEAIDKEEFMSELKAIREDLNYLKQHMVDIDSIMTEEDFLVLQSYRKEKDAGKLISHNQLKKELGL